MDHKNKDISSLFPKKIITADLKEIELRVLCAILSNQNINFGDMSDEFTIGNIINTAKDIAKAMHK